MTQLRMIHIGKTGGTALKTMFNSKRDELKSKGLSFKGRNHKATFEDVLEDRCENVIFFVRHPVGRFVSAFNSRLRQGAPRHHSAWTGRESLIFRAFKEPNALAEALSSERRNLAKAAEWSMRSINHVKDHMSKWLFSIDYLERNREYIFYLGTTETMDQDVEKLFNKIGISPPGQELDEVASHKTPAGFSKTLSDVAVENLTRWYAEDIKMYEWCLANRDEINKRELNKKRRPDF